MGKIKFKASGRLLTSTESERQKLLDDIVKAAAKSAEDFIKREFTRSMELSNMIGYAMDPEAIRALLRGLVVEVQPGYPIRMKAKFDDALGHLYGDEDLPKELAGILQSIIDGALEKWKRSPELQNKISEAIRS